MEININNRRYLGNKYKLLSFIRDTVEKECTDVKTVFDVFSGTGAVASDFLDKTVIVNDILYSNYLAHVTWFSSEKYDKKKIELIINKYNNLDEICEDNYMSLNFSNTFFNHEVCKKIGYIRQDIEDKYINKEINKRERAILITSLIYAMDKIANTCGHYDAYRKGAEYNNNFIMLIPKTYEKVSKYNKCYNMDSNELVKKVKADLAYLDPPYNSRQYCDAYHLLENVAKWEKSEVIGVARKMNRDNLKSDYCTVNATKAFEDLVENLDVRYILLSYNNTGNNSHDRSNAKISDDDIIRILSKKGKVKVFSKTYKAFTTGKSENNNNEERLFLCVCENKKKYISSPLNYTGGKYKLLSQIIPLFPDKIDNFIDLFCGGANVGINMEAKNIFYNDNNKELIGLLKMFKETPLETILSKIYYIISKYELSESSKFGYEFYNSNSCVGLGNYNKEKYNSLKREFNGLTNRNTDYYIMFFVLIVYGFNNQIRFNNSGKFNLPVGKRDFNNKIKEKLIVFITKIKEQNTIFTNLNFSDIDIKKITKNSFIYADPPYLITTATYNEKNSWSVEKENELLEFLDMLNNKRD